MFSMDGLFSNCGQSSASERQPRATSVACIGVLLVMVLVGSMANPNGLTSFYVHTRAHTHRDTYPHTSKSNYVKTRTIATSMNMST